MTPQTTPCVLVVMGVSSAGKTSLATRLQQRLGWTFQEGDRLHPPENVAKMRAGVPLTDADRWPWLDRIAAWIGERIAAGENAIVTCSALKRIYRDRVRQGRAGVRFAYLHGDPALLASRAAARQHEYMPASLLASQLATLEPPGADEPAIWLDVARPPDELAEQTIAALAGAQHRADG